MMKQPVSINNRSLEKHINKITHRWNFHHAVTFLLAGAIIILIITSFLSITGNIDFQKGSIPSSALKFEPLVNSSPSGSGITITTGEGNFVAQAVDYDAILAATGQNTRVQLSSSDGVILMNNDTPIYPNPENQEELGDYYAKITTDGKFIGGGMFQSLHCAETYRIINGFAKEEDNHLIANNTYTGRVTDLDPNTHGEKDYQVYNLVLPIEGVNEGDFVNIIISPGPNPTKQNTKFLDQPSGSAIALRIDNASDGTTSTFSHKSVYVDVLGSFNPTGSDTGNVDKYPQSIFFNDLASTMKDNVSVIFFRNIMFGSKISCVFSGGSWVVNCQVLNNDIKFGLISGETAHFYNTDIDTRPKFCVDFLLGIK